MEEKLHSSQFIARPTFAVKDSVQRCRSAMHFCTHHCEEEGNSGVWHIGCKRRQVICQNNVPRGTALLGLWSGTNILLAPLLGRQWESPISLLCQLGVSGNLCAAVHASIDENAEATGVVTTNVSSYRASGPARVTKSGMSHEAWSLKVLSFETWEMSCSPFLLEYISR